MAIRPPGRPAKGTTGAVTEVVAVRLPATLRKAIKRRAEEMHVSFNAAMQMAAMAWVEKGK